MDQASSASSAERMPRVDQAQLLASLRQALARSPRPDVTQAGFPLLGGMVGAASYDLVIHDECAAGIDDSAQVQNVLVAAEAILKYCIDIGGTLTGEHGVGVEKIHLMPYLFDGPTMSTFQRVKRAFDPDERINAGKLLPSDKVVVTLLKPGRHVPQ